MAIRKVFPERWIVYRITNTVNGKIYIGLTGTTIEQRWEWHVREANQARKYTTIGAAIRKYGADAFTIKRLASYDNEDAAIIREIYLIARYNSRTPNGYNMTSGGDGVPGVPPYHRSPECRLNMARIKGGKTHLPGTTWISNRNKWKAAVSINRRHIFLGFFDTPEEASARYLAALEAHRANIFQRPSRKKQRGIPRSFETRLNMARARSHINGLPGAQWSSKEQKWLAKLSINGKEIRLGCFNSPEEASEVWVAALEFQFSQSSS